MKADGYQLTAFSKIAIPALALLGMGISAYLTHVKLAGAEIFCIGGGRGCEAVNLSPYSQIAGIPIAAMGFGAYLAIFAISCWEARARASIRQQLRLGLFALSLIGVLYSGYLTYLQRFVIGAFCSWCVASAVIISIIFVLALINLRSVPA